MFKNYAVIQDGLVVEYPVDPRVWLDSENKFNIHEYWEGGELDGKTYVFCHNKAPSCGYDETLVEITPAFNAEKGLWYRQYNIIKVDDETLAERRQEAQRGVNEVLSRLLAEFNEMAQTISELDVVEQAKWQKYHDALTAIPSHPKYPFYYEIPFRPDYLDDLKIKVTRI